MNVDVQVSRRAWCPSFPTKPRAAATEQNYPTFMGSRGGSFQLGNRTASATLPAAAAEFISPLMLDNSAPLAPTLDHSQQRPEYE